MSVKSLLTRAAKVWDENGHAFTISLKKDIYIAPNKDGVWERVKGYPLNRNKLYDLKFE